MLRLCLNLTKMNYLKNFRLFLNCSKSLYQPVPYYSNYISRTLSDSNEDKNKQNYNLNKKYTKFRDEDSSIILDIEEERNKLLDEEKIVESESQFAGLNLTRGVTGVFDIQDLIIVLRREACEDIFVAKVPKEYKYVDYIVVTTGKSPRHIIAVSELIKRLYKIKRNSNDRITKIEGKDSKNWLAMDLGNISLHVFDKKERQIYDLETLWSVGSEFDEKSQKQEDQYIQMIQSHSLYLQNLKPVEN